MNSQQVTKWTLESISLGRTGCLEYAFENVVEYIPYLIPVFGGEVQMKRSFRTIQAE